jgi:hypothetical protein
MKDSQTKVEEVYKLNNTGKILVDLSGLEIFIADFE